MDLSRLQETDLPKRRPGTSESDWVMDMLLSRKGGKAHKAAIHVLSTGRSSANALLVQEATRPGRKPAHRLRLLDTVLQIGGPLSYDEYAAVYAICRSRSPRVCEKAEQVLLTLCPDGPPQSITLKRLEDASLFAAAELARDYGVKLCTPASVAAKS